MEEYPIVLLDRRLAFRYRTWGRTTKKAARGSRGLAPEPGSLGISALHPTAEWTFRSQTVILSFLDSHLEHGLIRAEVLWRRI